MRGGGGWSGWAWRGSWGMMNEAFFVEGRFFAKKTEGGGARMYVCECV